MIRLACTLFLSSLALAGAWAQEAKPPAPGPSARPHRWTVPPIEMERSRLESEEREVRRRECARLAASGSLAERQQALVLCGGTPGLAVLPDPPRPAPPPSSPTPVTTCDPAGCWDITGSRYNGSVSTMFRSDGKVCQLIGTMMHCP